MPPIDTHTPLTDEEAKRRLDNMSEEQVTEMFEVFKDPHQFLHMVNQQVDNLVGINLSVEEARWQVLVETLRGMLVESIERQPPSLTRMRKL